MSGSSNLRKMLLEQLVQNEGVQIYGFREALRGVAEELVLDDIGRVPDDEMEEAGSVESLIKWRYESEFLPVISGMLVPAYRIDKNDLYFEIHVWEIETSQKIPLWRYQAYGDTADRGGLCEGFRLVLHIIDHHGREVLTFTDDILECLWFAVSDSETESGRAELQAIFAKAAENAGVLDPEEIHVGKRRSTPVWETKRLDERAILNAVHELGLVKKGELV